MQITEAEVLMMIEKYKYSRKYYQHIIFKKKFKKLFKEDFNGQINSRYCSCSIACLKKYFVGRAYTPLKFIKCLLNVDYAYLSCLKTLNNNLA